MSDPGSTHLQQGDTTGRQRPTETPKCGSCGAEVGDGAHLCGDCTRRLTARLAEVPELVAELLVTRSRQDRIGDTGARVSGTAERPLGYRPQALDASTLLTSTLAVWVSVVCGPEFVTAGDTAKALAGTLAAHIEAIRRHPAAPELAAELSYVTGFCRGVIDRPPAQSYAGPCACGVDLYAKAGARDVVCQVCAARYLMADRREYLLDALRDHLATAAEIAAGIGELHGQVINRNTITKWRERGRLIPAGATDSGDPLFRIGDVLDVATATRTRQTTPK